MAPCYKLLLAYFSCLFLASVTIPTVVGFENPAGKHLDAVLRSARNTCPLPLVNGLRSTIAKHLGSFRHAAEMFFHIVECHNPDFPLKSQPKSMPSVNLTVSTSVDIIPI